ncbi:MAG: helix-turn-helix transcriptional regulator [Defluviitaleaceae bacterium]|nr:helix-turn-helix transcriptional regulator [Defluviitaleaceae bacterium]
MEGKWKLKIIYTLANSELLRYGELKRALVPITHKMLSAQLKELERDGIVLRTEYPQIPPRVEYSLSAKGDDMIAIFKEMWIWGHKYKN